jgi:hypothetical protein
MTLEHVTGDDEEIERQGIGLEEVLRSVEDALVDNAWTDSNV